MGFTVGSVGAALGTTEDAAQKRVSRALEKLRGLLHTFHKMIELEELDSDSLDPSRRDE